MKVELDDDLLDFCIVQSLNESLECLERDLEDPDSCIFSTDFDDEKSEIQAYINAFKLVRGWYL